MTDHMLLKYVVVKFELKLTRTETSQRFTICAIASRCYSEKKKKKILLHRLTRANNNIVTDLSDRAIRDTSVIRA